MWEKLRTPALALTMLLVLAGCVLAWASNGLEIDWWGWVSWFIRLGSAVHLPVSAFLLVGGVCYARTRRNGILWLAIVSTAFYAISGSLLNYQPAPRWLATGSVGYVIALLVEYLTRASVAVPLMIMLSVRLRDRWDRVRPLMLVCIGVLFVFEAGELISLYIPWLYRNCRWVYRSAEVGTMITLYLTIIVGAIAAWAVAFRQVPMGRPPADAGKKMAFTCPRCGLAQELSLPAGECRGCRLKLHVALDEGNCVTCGYALRGLTGDKCPECGTPLTAVTAAANPES